MTVCEVVRAQVELLKVRIVFPKTLTLPRVQGVLSPPSVLKLRVFRFALQSESAIELHVEALVSRMATVGLIISPSIEVIEARSAFVVLSLSSELQHARQNKRGIETRVLSEIIERYFSLRFSKMFPRRVGD